MLSCLWGGVYKYFLWKVLEDGRKWSRIFLQKCCYSLKKLKSEQEICAFFVTTVYYWFQKQIPVANYRGYCYPSMYGEREGISYLYSWNPPTGTKPKRKLPAIIYLVPLENTCLLVWILPRVLVLWGFKCLQFEFLIWVNINIGSINSVVCLHDSRGWWQWEFHLRDTYSGLVGGTKGKVP